MTDEKKRNIRIKSLQKRDALTKQERLDYSREIIRKLTTLPCYQKTDALLVYVSFRSEVDTLSLINKAVSEGKHIFVPKVQGREMEFYRITDLSQLREGYRSILEPESDESYPDYLAQIQRRHPNDSAGTKRISYTLLCMPGVAFDAACHRIGYGGGFYDRYLERLAVYQAKDIIDLTTVALAYTCQMWEQIPWEPHDMKPDIILTEQNCVASSRQVAQK